MSIILGEEFHFKIMTQPNRDTSLKFALKATSSNNPILSRRSFFGNTSETTTSSEPQTEIIEVLINGSFER